jgi:hypothetical protein
MAQDEGNIRIGIVACEILKREIEQLAKDDPDIVHREFLDFALYIDLPRIRTLTSAQGLV